MALKITTPQSLNDLKDEILTKITLWLPINELCTFAGVCRRFRLLAYRTFKQNYAHRMVFTNPIERMTETTRIIKCFGQYITSITLDGSIVWDLNQDILQLIEQYCRSNLKKLRLIHFHFNKKSIAIMKSLVRKLNTIELLYCTIEKNQFRVTYNIALKEVENLKELVIIGADKNIDLKFLNKNWPEFDKLEIIGPQLTNQQMLVQFLKKNRRVKYFSYLPHRTTSAAQSFIKWFNFDMPNIQELSIEFSHSNLYSFLLEALPKLRRIVINCKGFNEPIRRLIDILSKKDTLEVLSLWHVKYHEILIIPSIVGLKTLELREVESVLNRNALVYTIAQRWNNVENLYLDHSAISSDDNIGILIENMMQLNNLYLCDMKSFYLLPTWGIASFAAWCSKRQNPVQIYIDSRYLPPGEANVPYLPIVFRAFNGRISQMVNVICANSFN